MTNNGIFISKISPLIPELFKFCSKSDDVTNRLSTKINHKIKNILGNIGMMLLKFGNCKCTSSKTQNGTYSVVAMATVLLPGLFHSHFLS